MDRDDILHSKNLEYMAEHGNFMAAEFLPMNSVKNDNFVLPYPITDPILKDMHLVESYLSDVLISLQGLYDKVQQMSVEKQPEYVVFGLRKQGVDGNSFFMTNLEDWYDTNDFTSRSHYYRRIYVIKIAMCMPDQDKIAIKLVDATNTIPYSNLDEKDKTKS